MSGTFPSTPPLEDVKIKSWAPTLVSVAHNLGRQVRSRGVHRWLIDAALPENLTRAELAPLAAFLVAQRGRYGTFTFIPPVVCDALGTATGTPLVAGAGQTGRSVATDGWTPSVTGILLAGDFLKFGGHNKVYLVVEDADSDGSGAATLSIEPALQASPADNEALVVDSVPFTVALVTDEAAWSQDGPLYSLERIQMVEDPS